MRLALFCVTAADTGGEGVPQIEFLQLAMDAVAIAAGDEAEVMTRAEAGKNAASSGDEFRFVIGVLRSPDLIGGVPFVFGQFCGAIDAIPIGRIVLFEFGEAPGNAHGAEHGEISGGIGGVRIEKRAVPIEEDAAKG